MILHWKRSYAISEIFQFLVRCLVNCILPFPVWSLFRELLNLFTHCQVELEQTQVFLKDHISSIIAIGKPQWKANELDYPQSLTVRQKW